MKLAPNIMNEVFYIIEFSYPLKNKLQFKSRNICTVRNEIKITAFFALGYGTICLLNYRRILHQTHLDHN